MPKTLNIHDCKTGFDFENAVVNFLREYGFESRRVGKNDGGVDVIAKITIGGTVQNFCIQCKYVNSTLGKRPVQEIFTGLHSLKIHDADAVVITNNSVTAEARIYAKTVGVEIIADAELREIEQVYKSKKIINNKHTGLMGIILSTIVQDNGLLLKSIEKTKPKLPSDKEQLKLQIISDYDAAISYSREAERLQQQASQYQQKALEIQKQALLRNLDYG
jgi:Holliday junction resolvase